MVSSASSVARSFSVGAVGVDGVGGRSPIGTFRMRSAPDRSGSVVNRPERGVEIDGESVAADPGGIDQRFVDTRAVDGADSAAHPPAQPPAQPVRGVDRCGASGVEQALEHVYQQ